MKKLLYENRFLFYGVVLGLIAKSLFEWFALTLPSIQTFIVLILFGMAFVPPVFALDNKYIKQKEN